MTSKTQITKAKIQWDYIKLEKFYIAKETVNRVEKVTFGME